MSGDRPALWRLGQDRVGGFRPSGAGYHMQEQGAHTGAGPAGAVGLLLSDSSERVYGLITTES